MQWLDAVLASVPVDFVNPVEQLPDGATKLAPLPDDLIPVMRAWLYTQEQMQETRKIGVDKSMAALISRMEDPAFDEKSSLAELETIVGNVDRLERQEEALRKLLAAALWEQFPSAEDECLGTAFTADGWTAFRMPDDREESAFAAILAIPTR